MLTTDQTNTFLPDQNPTPNPDWQVTLDKMQAALDGAHPYVSAIYDAMHHRSEIGQAIRQYSFSSIHALELARATAKWAARHVVTGRLFTEEERNAFQYQPKLRFITSMNALYQALIFSIETYPGAPEERILRAFLDHRSKFETGAWGDLSIFPVKDGIDTFSPAAPQAMTMTVDQGLFIGTATIEFYEHDDRVRFRSAPYVAMVKAIYRLFAAWFLTACIENEAAKYGVALKYVAPKAIDLIRGVHERTPLALASGHAISRFDYWREIEDRLFPPTNT